MTVTSLSKPDPGDAAAAIEDGLAAGAMVTVVGECVVDYEGRTNSFLPAGERLVVLKPDGTLLVHRTEKRKPVNWQPPGSELQAIVEEGDLHVRSSRRDPEEVVDARFESVHQVSTMALTDGRALELSGTEEDLRQRILADPSLLERGFRPQATERANVAGPADIYGEDGDGRPVIVELKRRRTGPDAVSQLKRYVEQFLRETAVDADRVRGVLVAPSVTDTARQLLDEEGLEFVALDPPEEPRTTTATLSEFTEE
ncbi:MAG: endonuclease NucS [Halobacteriales archaeon]